MKYSLFAANIIILLGGIAVTAVGGVTLHDQTIFADLVDDSLYRSASYVLIGTGVFIMMFAFLGCYGAIKEVKCFLLTYIIVLLIFFVVLLIGGVLGYVFKGKVSEPLKLEMQRTITEYHKNPLIKSTWENVQNVFHCCGVVNYTDWEKELHGDEKVPMSCCRKKEDVDCVTHPTFAKVWDAGCLQRFKEGASVVGGVGIAVACLLILGLVFSYGVFRSIT